MLWLGFMGLKPGVGPRRAWISLAEFERGRAIWGGGSCWGPPPYGPGDMERGGPLYGALLLDRARASWGTKLGGDICNGAGFTG